MRIRAAGISVTVAELRALLTESDTRDDAEVLMADYGAVTGAEAGPFSLELETELEPIDEAELLETCLDFLEELAEGTDKGPKALAALRQGAREIVRDSGRAAPA